MTELAAAAGYLGFGMALWQFFDQTLPGMLDEHRRRQESRTFYYGYTPVWYTAWLDWFGLRR